MACTAKPLTDPAMRWNLQVALIVIMAQIGSFVPAKFASMHVVDKLFTRIGTSDSIETNSSSFMVEMQETAHIVNHATDK